MSIFLKKKKAAKCMQDNANIPNMQEIDLTLTEKQCQNLIFLLEKESNSCMINGDVALSEELSILRKRILLHCLLYKCSSTTSDNSKTVIIKSKL
jgi:hypothetical protein